MPPPAGGAGPPLGARADFDTAAAAALSTAVGANPAHEDAAVALMRVYASRGDWQEALAEYRRLRAALERAAGAGPGPAAERGYEQILTGQVFQPDLTGDSRMLSGDVAGTAAGYASALDAARPGARGPAAVRLHRKAATAYVQQHDSEAVGSQLRAAEEDLTTDGDRADAGRVRGVRANWLWEVGRYAVAQQAAEASPRRTTASGCCRSRSPSTQRSSPSVPARSRRSSKRARPTRAAVTSWGTSWAERSRRIVRRAPRK
ncbi:BTAD domain-containing putative transcriptional regulator [Streptomyces sp. NPDC019531]|uniref:BTAD domain-containing putative transcriptional regulator n=1 Tax=Streptomyces sp. NPDC019531 TaxID=3365062 RepID=UPI003850A152